MNEQAIKREIFFKKWGYNLFGEHYLECNPFKKYGKGESIFNFTLKTSIAFDNGQIFMSVETEMGHTIESDSAKPIRNFVADILVKFNEYVRTEGEDYGWSEEDFFIWQSYIETYLENVIKTEYYLAEKVREEIRQSDLFPAFKDYNVEEKQDWVKKFWKLIDDTEPETKVLDCEKLTNGDGLEISLSLFGEQILHKILDFRIADIPHEVGKPCCIGVNVSSLADGELYYDNIEDFSISEIERMYDAVVKLLNDKS